MESDNQNAEKKAPDAVEGTPAGRDLLVIPRETGVPSTPDSKWIVSVDIGAPDPFDGGCAADAGGHTPPVEMPTFKRLDTTMRPMPDTVGKAIERAKDKIDYDAADIGLAAFVLAQGINPGGSTAGRERLVDEITQPRKVAMTVYLLQNGGNRLSVKCEADYPHGLQIGDKITHSDVEYVVCDVDTESSSLLVFIHLNRTAPLRGIKERDILTFTVGGGT